MNRYISKAWQHIVQQWHICIDWLLHDTAPAYPFDDPDIREEMEAEIADYEGQKAVDEQVRLWQKQTSKPTKKPR